MGSKNRHAKELLPMILKDRRDDQWYVEPFVGGFNMIDKVSGLRLANDSHYYLIELFRAIQNGWVPPDNLSEEEYKDIKNNQESYPPYLVGFVGFGCSFSGKWFGGYARGLSSNGEPRNYCLESKNNILKQAPNIQGVIIENKSYLDLEIPDNSIIYCDPPYQNTTKYSSSNNHEIFGRTDPIGFWNWVRDKSKEGHQVFVSEYSAPSDFKCIWEKGVISALDVNSRSKKNVEKLFTY